MLLGFDSNPLLEENSNVKFNYRMMTIIIFNNSFFKPCKTLLLLLLSLL